MRKKEEEKRKKGRKEKIQETLKREKNGYKERINNCKTLNEVSKN